MTKSSQVKIRKANIGDVEAIYKTIFEAFEPYKKHFTRDAYEMTVISHTEIKKRILDDKREILVAICDNEIVGSVTIGIKDQSNIYIQSMAVRPKYQGKGIGLRILEEIDKIAQKKKCKKILLECFYPLKKAILLYEKCGFERTKKIRDYYGIRIFEMLKEVK
ncbi:MAG TPA: GNAT family N-acetyltransferase [Thermoplasmatales archaeon]|nr:GNAT family N-acetyltransferase [Thermoplasmatales archaeon]